MGGLYIKEWYPIICLAVFILECSKGQGQITGSFLEQKMDAYVYQGETLGLMAIHLILTAGNKDNLTLTWSTAMDSNYIGALGRATQLLANMILTPC